MTPGFAARHWYRFTALSALLFPLSIVFGLLVWIRRTLYRTGLLPASRLPVPVIVVGNIMVGGTGKTPLVIWLAHFLCSRGMRPGIVTRGHGGARREPAAVSANDDPRICGDEPVLLARRTGVPVWSGVNRLAAGRALLEAYSQCDVLICDDGLQHYRLARDIEIAVEDGRGVGNGLMLPAGPLREPASRRVDARVINSKDDCPPGAFRMQLETAGIYRLDRPDDPLEVTALQALRVHAVAGIGDPQRFFASVKALGLEAIAHAFADHHDFQPHDLEFENCDAVLMTEKDAVKCVTFPRTDLFALRVDAVIDPAFVQFLEKRLHGFKTA